MTPVITIDARIGELIEACPSLEEALVSLVPAWARLANPVLRRTVIHGSTVAQAAGMAGIAPAVMVSALREALGVNGDPSGNPEAWLMGAAVVEEIDADAMLKTGVHPVGRVKESVAGLAPGHAVQLKSSFSPRPLIDMMRGAGYAVTTLEVEPGRHMTRFGRTP